jgi:putative ABC transport system permease protein
MITNYIKVGIRNIQKNKLAAFINTTGLALSVGCCLVVFVFIDWSFHMDTFHTKLDRLYVLEKVAGQNGEKTYEGPSPAPMAEMLQNEFPQIKNTSRVNFVDAIIKEGDRVFHQSVSFVDDSFHDMFDFPIKWGNKSAFTDPNGIVLTEELSEMLFGKVNSIGKIVNIRFNQNGQEFVENFNVTGVFKKKPYETSFYFSALIPFKKMPSLAMNYQGDWSRNVEMTFIETTNETAVLPKPEQITKYVNLYNEANKNTPIIGYHFQPLKSMNLHSYKLSYTRFFNTHILGLFMLIFIALAVLIMTCFNYMNIAVASASNRIKEIGMRKSMGSTRWQIIFQFLMENFILCTIGVGLGLILAWTLFIPWFSQGAGFDLTEKLFTNVRVWVSLGCLLVLTILGGSAYPAFYISGLNPVNIVKGNFILGSTNRFRKVLLGFQFFLTFIGISMSLSFVRDNHNTRARSWGYAPTNNVVTRIPAGNSYDLLTSELKSNDNIQSVTGSVQPLGKWSNQLVVKSEGKDLPVQCLQALPGFATKMGIEITNGRDLSDDIESDKTGAILVNQAFLKERQWETGIGKTIEYNKNKYLIVGETNDFRFENYESELNPLIVMGCLPSDIEFTYIKTKPNDLSAPHTIIEKEWKKIFPDTPYEYYYQETVFDQYYAGAQQIISVMSMSSMIMVIISISGIFGLALLILSKKMKEISVRKVLGAGSLHISIQILKEFLQAIVIAFILGIPISYFFTNSIFVVFSPESDISPVPFLISFIALVLMTVISVVWHLYKAFVSDPTEYLKDN